MSGPIQPPGGLTIKLPKKDRFLETYRLSARGGFPAKQSGPLNRVAFAAAHVVANPLADCDPWLDAAIDWDRTIAYREYLWDLGLGVAEAMDTAQRGMGLDWNASLELVKRSIDAAKARDGALLFSGAGTDHLAPEDAKAIGDVIRAYEMQIEAVESAGGRIILMASRALCRVARHADDYAEVYSRVLQQVKAPVIIHWLGDMFDPALAGYWGSRHLDEAMDTAIAVLNANAAKIDGVKISLLDKNREIEMRRRLPRSIRMYTGDDFNFPELIAGDEQGHSDALLGIFDTIAPAASAALTALARGDRGTYDEILAPAVTLSRHIFRAPTRFYKTGVVFMAYLNGHQDHFTMIGGQQSARSILHLSDLFRLADSAGLFRDPSLAASRMRTVLLAHGVDG
ncbi:MAG: dihydrodipicolinate synthase family protein [Rhodomicrobium sp.]